MTLTNGRRAGTFPGPDRDPRPRSGRRGWVKVVEGLDPSNDDMLYVLSTFVYDPIDWIDRYGWRRLHPHERLASFHFYRQVGIRMGIKHIPDSYQEFHRFKMDYEREKFVYSDDNHRIGTYTLELFQSWYPGFLARPVATAVYALIDERVSLAFGFPKGSPRVRAVAEAGLRARSAVVRLLPKRRTSSAATDPDNRTYPGYPVGYCPRDLGVEHDHSQRAN